MLKLFSLLFESILRGEWWIDDDGNAMFADGDIGDYNHEAYVVNQLTQQLLEQFDIADYEERPFFDYYNDIKAFIGKENSELEAGFNNNPRKTMVEFLVSKGYKGGNREDITKMFKVLSGEADGRDYAMEEWGWIRTQNNIVQLYHLDYSSIKHIVNGLYEAYGEDVEDETFVIETINPRQVFENVPWLVLEQAKNNMSVLLPYR